MIRRSLAAALPVALLGITLGAAPASAALPEPNPAKARTAEAQLRLNALGLEKPLAVDGAYGHRTDGALDAERGAPGSGVTEADLARLRAKTTGGWTVRVFKDQQKTRISHRGIPVATVTSGTASGKFYRAKDGSVHRAVTPVGPFTVTREIEGWRQSSSVEGALYDPHYFKGGWALHGSTAPAGRSHGCVRLSLHVAAALDEVLGVGDRIVIEGVDPAPPARGPGSRHEPTA